MLFEDVELGNQRDTVFDLVHNGLAEFRLCNEPDSPYDLILLRLQALDESLKLVGRQVDFVERLLPVHVHEDLQVLLDHVQFLPQGDKTDAVVKVAVDGDLRLPYDLRPVIAAHELDALEALLDEVFPEREDERGEENGQQVHLSLLAIEDFFFGQQDFGLVSG